MPRRSRNAQPTSVSASEYKGLRAQCFSKGIKCDNSKAIGRYLHCRQCWEANTICSPMSEAVIVSKNPPEVKLKCITCCGVKAPCDAEEFCKYCDDSRQRQKKEKRCMRLPLDSEACKACKDAKVNCKKKDFGKCWRCHTRPDDPCSTSTAMVKRNPKKRRRPDSRSDAGSVEIPGPVIIGPAVHAGYLDWRLGENGEVPPN